MQGAQILKMSRTYGYAAMIYPVESCEAGPQSGIQPSRGCSATQQMDFLRNHQGLILSIDHRSFRKTDALIRKPFHLFQVVGNDQDCQFFLEA